MQLHPDHMTGIDAQTIHPTDLTALHPSGSGSVPGLVPVEAGQRPGQLRAQRASCVPSSVRKSVTRSSQRGSVCSLAASGSPGAGRTCQRVTASRNLALNGSKAARATDTTGRAPQASSSPASCRPFCARPASVNAQPPRPAHSPSAESGPTTRPSGPHIARLRPAHHPDQQLPNTAVVLPRLAGRSRTPTNAQRRDRGATADPATPPHWATNWATARRQFPGSPTAWLFPHPPGRRTIPRRCQCPGTGSGLRLSSGTHPESGSGAVQGQLRGKLGTSRGCRGRCWSHERNK